MITWYKSAFVWSDNAFLMSLTLAMSSPCLLHTLYAATEEGSMMMLKSLTTAKIIAEKVTV